MAIELDSIRPVEPREVWQNEAADFTPWLLDNPQVLSELLGMELELHEAEHSVGDFSLDLIGTDNETHGTVIVENQLEISDHTHLGQLLTYAAGTDPTTVVWIARKFREEHRAALDWLNERTNEQTRFFGVEIGVVKIGDSRPAPNFKLIAKPNSWGKTVKAANTSRELSDREQLRQEFWNYAFNLMKSRHPEWGKLSPGPDSWYYTRSGVKNFNYTVEWRRKGLASVASFEGNNPADNLRRFQEVKASEREFTEALGQDVEWDENPDRKAQRILVWSRFSDLENREQWPEMVEWLISSQESLRRAFEAIGGVPN